VYSGQTFIETLLFRFFWVKIMSSGDVSISVDENNRIRVLPAEKFKLSEDLKDGCSEFVSSMFICCRCLFIMLCIVRNN
jgi:hypothetical protein